MAEEPKAIEPTREAVAAMLDKIPPHVCRKKVCEACGRQMWFIGNVPYSDSAVSHFKDCTDPNRFSKKGKTNG